MILGHCNGVQRRIARASFIAMDETWSDIITMTCLFERPDQEFIDRLGEELSTCYRKGLRDDWNKVDCSRIVSFCGKTWFIKSRPEDPESKNRELLAFLLGGSWLNIPEVRLLSSDEFQSLFLDKAELLGEKASEQNTYLVRMAQDYEIGELPIQGLDSAIASEIAFSIWVQRRDAHAGNRAFVHGIPMFFDFHIAFGAEAGGFFRWGPDTGFVENWRLFQVKNDASLKDIQLLTYLEFDKSIAAIPIISKSHFEGALFRFAEYIRDYDLKDLYGTIQKAGFSEERSILIYEFLEKSSEDMEANLNRVLYIINKGEKHSIIVRGMRCYRENGLAYTLAHLYYYLRLYMHSRRISSSSTSIQ